MTSTLRVKLIASIALVVCLAGMGALTPVIAASVGRNELGYADTAEASDPPQVAAGIAMGAFRGLFVNYLWIRANNLKEEGRFHESVELARAITKLQPRFPRVWAFHAWNLSYNISVATQTAEERWRWVQAGADLLKNEGIPANPNDMLLHKELSWIYLHKIGGFTDDSNRYYKKKVAERWTILVGEPPLTSAGLRSRDAVIERYVEWLEAIENAPDTLEGVYEAEPKARELAGKIRAQTAFEPDEDLLREYVFLTRIDNSLDADRIRRTFTSDISTLAELAANPANRAGWDALIAHLRKRAIIDEEHMSLTTMVRYTRKYGPIDWRLSASHALYWAARGVEQGLSRVTDVNERDFDFVNTDRLVMQSIQELWRYGSLYFNYVDFAYGGLGFYQATPNEYFVQSYGDIAEEIEERGGVFESDRRVYRQYAAGYENFLTDAILFFYRRGQTNEAEKWYTELRSFENQNMHNTEWRVNDLSRPLDEFVTKNLFDRYRSPNVAAAEIAGGLQGAYVALLQGDEERFRSSFDYASRTHQYYLGRLEDGQQAGEGQLRNVHADDGSGRMEVLDRDFKAVAGGMFAATVSSLPPQEASLMYQYAPNDLQRYAFDALAARYKPAIDDGRLDLGDPFAVVFPEPPGMEQHRAMVRAKEVQRIQSGVRDSIERQ